MRTGGLAGTCTSTCADTSPTRRGGRLARTLRLRQPLASARTSKRRTTRSCSSPAGSVRSGPSGSASSVSSRGASKASARFHCTRPAAIAAGSNARRTPTGASAGDGRGAAKRAAMRSSTASARVSLAISPEFSDRPRPSRCGASIRRWRSSAASTWSLPPAIARTAASRLAGSKLRFSGTRSATPRTRSQALAPTASKPRCNAATNKSVPALSRRTARFSAPRLAASSASSSPSAGGRSSACTALSRSQPPSTGIGASCARAPRSNAAWRAASRPKSAAKASDRIE